MRRGRDSNPGGAQHAQWFSRPPQSTTLPPLHNLLSIQAAITLVTLSQHNNVINFVMVLSDLSKNYSANLQINIVKSKFFLLVLGMSLTNQLVLGDGIEPTSYE